ncbi:MAG: hypothetical protein HGB21_05825 [Nitrospirae bacterium]|nr:hypothetical protein [Nitrospirota bacterium]NTW65821.1 hypothetical protein [Nitrospirota bacterium]
MKTSLGTLIVLCSMLTTASAAEKKEITGAVAYTDVLRYDHTGDGKRDRVQFWMEFSGSPAIGAPGDPGHQPESGSIRYYLQDADTGTKVMKWRKGLDMEGAPKDAPLPMTNISIKGNTARFEAFGMNWTITDGGEGYEKDKIVVDDGFKTLETKKLYGGDVRIGPAK